MFVRVNVVFCHAGVMAAEGNQAIGSFALAGTKTDLHKGPDIAKASRAADPVLNKLAVEVPPRGRQVAEGQRIQGWEFSLPRSDGKNQARNRAAASRSLFWINFQVALARPPLLVAAIIRQPIQIAE